MSHNKLTLDLSLDITQILSEERSVKVQTLACTKKRVFSNVTVLNLTHFRDKIANN